MVCRPFWIAISGQKMFSDFSEGVALGNDGSGLWPVTILPAINVEEPSPAGIQRRLA
jgi:hypothetical protein